MTDHDSPPPDAGDEPSRDQGTEVPVAKALQGEVTVDRSSDQIVPSWLNATAAYGWRALVILAALGVSLYALTRLYLVSLPVLVALILATICVPPARRLERVGVPRLMAASIVVIGGIGGLVGIIALLTPTFIEQGRELAPSVVEGADSVLVWLEEGPIGYDRTELETLFSQAMTTLEDSAGTIATSVGAIVIGIGKGIAALALAIVLLFFFVKDGDEIVAWFIRLIPDHHSDTVRAAGARGWVALSGFVRGTALVALIDALGIGLGLALLGVPAYLPLSVLVFFGAFIPVIGATVTGLLAVLVALASGGLVTALIATGIVLLVQQIESNVLQPTIMRRAVALHPVVVLGVLTAGAVLIGIVGAFLAVPVAAVAAAVGNELRLRHEIAKRGGVAGPTPIGGPGVDPETVSVRFPQDTQLRSARRRREGTNRQRRARERTRERIAVDSELRGAEVARDEPDTSLITADLKIPLRPSGSTPRRTGPAQPHPEDDPAASERGATDDPDSPPTDGPPERHRPGTGRSDPDTD